MARSLSQSFTAEPREPAVKLGSARWSSPAKGRSQFMATNQISMNPFLVARFLGALTCLVILASVAALVISYATGHSPYHGFAVLFYVDAERNIPSFFSTLLLLFAALLLTVITVLARNSGASHVPHWAILSLGFVLMAFDESMTIHEKLVVPMRQLLGEGDLGPFYFAWVIPGIVLVAVLGLFFLKFLWHLPVKTRLTFLVAAVLYLGGALGVELIGGAYAELHGTHSLTYGLIATAEEALEMMGTIVFIWGLLVYMGNHHGEVWFRLEKTDIDILL